MSETAYPLSWPAAWKRTPAGDRKSARFGKKDSRSNYRGAQALTVSQAVDRLVAELYRLFVDGWIISTNIETRLDGTPRSNRPEPTDPGVAVYFEWRKRKTVFACDRWDRVADNIAAIAAHIDCLRGIERYGVGDLEQAFRGYQALPAPDFVHNWREVLGDCKTRAEAEAKFRARAMACHPDQGGDGRQMADLNLAIRDARQELNRTA